MAEEATLKQHRKAHREYLDGKAPKTEASKKLPARNSSVKPDQGLKQTDLVAFNQDAEKAAVSYLTEYIQHKGAPNFNTACSLIALELDVSVETAKRYLRKHSVDHPKAAFCIQDGSVTIRSKPNGKQR